MVMCGQLKGKQCLRVERRGRNGVVIYVAIAVVAAWYCCGGIVLFEWIVNPPKRLAALLRWQGIANKQASVAG